MEPWQAHFEKLKRDHRTPLILTALFALLLLWTVVSGIQSITATRAIGTRASITAPVVQPAVHIASLHLFGLYDTSVTDLPITQLQFTLHGTVVFLDTPDQSRALISAPGAPTKVYKIGDTLPGNATITAISKYDVVLNDNGTLEKLALPVNILKGEVR